MQLGHKTDVSLLRQDLSDRTARLASAQQQLDDRTAQLASAQQQLDDRTAQLISAQQQLDDRTAQLTLAQQQLASMQTEMARAVARIDVLEHSLEDAIEGCDDRSAKLAAALADIQTLQRTVSWRLTAPLRAIRRTAVHEHRLRAHAIAQPAAGAAAFQVVGHRAPPLGHAYEFVPASRVARKTVDGSFRFRQVAYPV